VTRRANLLTFQATPANTLFVTARRAATPVSRIARGPTVQAWVLPHLINWVNEVGGDAAAIRRLPGLENVSDPDLRLPESAVENAWRLAAALTGDDAIGIHVAMFLPRGALDLVEYATRSSASLALGLERLVRYGRVISDRVAARMEGNDERLLLLVRDTGGTPLHQGRAEFALALALKLARDCTGHDVVPVEVSFAHGAPRHVEEHRRFFRSPVRFAAGTNALVLRAADAMLPMQGADEALATIVRRRLDKALGERDQQAPDRLSARVRRLLVEHLGQTPMTPVAVADALAMSRRTLSRRLAREGTTFRSLLDDVRREFACALLLDRSSSIADIAYFLQFSEPTAFHRSFRRWTGQTPRAFRGA
jgi:AraC-like DNA-binding protein